MPILLAEFVNGLSVATNMLAPIRNTRDSIIERYRCWIHETSKCLSYGVNAMENVIPMNATGVRTFRSTIQLVDQISGYTLPDVII